MTTEQEQKHTPGPWLPIETAPKDGTRILLFREGQQYVGRWYPVYETWGVAAQREPGEWGSFTSIGECRVGQVKFWDGPTHWMPLPPPPATGAQ